MPTRAKIVTRTETTSSNSTENLNKGSKLTFAEMDSNFIELQNQSIGIADDGSTVIDITAGNTLTVAGAGGIQTSVSGQTLTIDGSNLGTIGDLTVTGSTISAPSNADLTLTNSGTGNIDVDSNRIINLATPSSGTDAATKDYVDSATSAVGGADLGNLQVNDTTLSPITTNDDLILTSNGTGNIVVQGITYDTSPSTPPGFTGTALKGGTIASQIEFTDNGTLYLRAGSNFSAKAGGGYDLNLYTNQKLRVIDSSGIVIGNTNIDASISTLTGGSLTLHTAENVNSGYIKINDTANQNIQIIPDGTGKIQLDNNYWPNTDGTSGQVLQTNGAGVLSWGDKTTVDPITFVGDDSTGTAVTPGETFRIAGATGITTAVAGDTLTITGPDLSSYITASSSDELTNKTGNISQWTNDSGYITDANITIVGDDSTGITFSARDNDDIKITGTGGITSTVSGNTITIDGSGVSGGGGSATGLTFVGDDSTGTLIADGETVKIAGGSGITTAMSGDTLTITASGSANTGDFVFTGNNMSTGSSNADMELEASGTGRIKILPNGFVTTDFIADRYISIDNADSRTTGIFEYQQDSGYTGSSEIYPWTRQVSVKTDGTDTSSSSARIRNFDSMSLDLNGSAWTASSAYISRGLQRFYAHTVTNRHATDAAEVRNAAAHHTTLYAGQNDLTADLTIQDMAGYVANLEILNNTGTTTINNAYGFYWNPDAAISGTAVVDNAYGLYINANNRGVITNNYSVYSEDKAAKCNPGAMNEYNEYAYTATHSSAGTYTVDANNGNLQVITLGANITSFTMSNFPTSTSTSKGVTLYLIQDGTGGRSITYSAGGSETFKFANGTNSSSNTAAGDITVVYIFSRYNGSSNTYYWTIGPAYS